MNFRKLFIALSLENIHTVMHDNCLGKKTCLKLFISIVMIFL